MNILEIGIITLLFVFFSPNILFKPFFKNKWCNILLCSLFFIISVYFIHSFFNYQENFKGSSVQCDAARNYQSNIENKIDTLYSGDRKLYNGLVANNEKIVQHVCQSNYNYPNTSGYVYDISTNKMEYYNKNTKTISEYNPNPSIIYNLTMQTPTPPSLQKQTTENPLLVSVSLQKQTTPKPTTPKPTTPKPTTLKPTTPKPTTPKPTTAKPTTPKPTTAKPTTPKPTTAKPTTPKPTTPKPTTY